MQKNTGYTAVRLLLEQYGMDSLSYFSLHEKKKFFFSSTGNSFLAYTVLGRVALISGDPIGLPSDITTLLKEFHFFIKGANYSSCFVGITESMLPQLMSYGHKTLPIGNEAVIFLSNFNKALLKKKVRRAEKHVASLGIECKIYKRSAIPPFYFNQLSSISKEWLEQKGRKEKGFSMTLGRLPKTLDEDCEIVLAINRREILGYLTFVPVYATNSLSLDSMRKKHTSPNGLTEFLLLRACEYYKKRGLTMLNLNFTTFYQGSETNNRQSPSFITSAIFKGLSRLYQTNHIYSFNTKFLPQWRERYVAYEKRRFLPQYLFAIAKTEL